MAGKYAFNHFKASYGPAIGLYGVIKKLGRRRKGLDRKWEAKYWKGRNKGTGLNKEALRESELEKGGGTREKAGSKEKEDEEDIKARESREKKEIKFLK